MSRDGRTPGVAIECLSRNDGEANGGSEAAEISWSGLGASALPLTPAQVGPTRCPELLGMAPRGQAASPAFAFQGFLDACADMRSQPRHPRLLLPKPR